jgi:hypothetical protein
MLNELFDNVDLNKPLRMICEGHSYGKWAILASTNLGVDADIVSDAEAEITEYIQNFNNLVNACYKEGKDGYLQIGEVSIYIVRYNAIKFRIVNKDHR